MALIYHSNIRIMYAYAALFRGFTNPFAISVYSGTQPSAADVASNWTNYNATSKGLLWHTQGVGLEAPSTTAISVFASTIPAAVAPLSNGTGTWAIAWSTDVTAAQVQGTTLPNSRFMVIDVTNNAGLGALRFTSTTFSTTTPVTFLDFGIAVY